jgi:hypothetical protein
MSGMPVRMVGVVGNGNRGCGFLPLPVQEAVTVVPALILSGFRVLGVGRNGVWEGGHWAALPIEAQCGCHTGISTATAAKC